MQDLAPEDLPQLLKRLAVLLFQNIDARLKPYDLARTQYIALHYLHDSPGISTGELAERMQIEPATLSGIADTLAAKGLIERVDDTSDKRRKNLRLTDDGRKLYAKIPPPKPIMEDVLERGVSHEDATAFKQTGQKMLENLYEELKKQEEGKLC